MDFGAIKASRLQPVKSFSGVRTTTARLHSDVEEVEGPIKPSKKRKKRMPICKEGQNPHQRQMLLTELEEGISDLQRSLERLQALKSKTKSSFPINPLGDSDRYERKKEPEEEAYEDDCDDGQNEYDENSYNEDGHFDDLDGDEDSKVCFPCPFCYVEIDIHDLCNHLQDEHCFDLKNAVCPLCAAILGRDATGHFMVQHACSLRRRRKSQKTGSWHVDTTTLGKELSSFLGSSTDGRGNPLQSASDPLLSPFLCSLPASDTKVDQRNNYDKVPAASNLKSTEATMQADGQNAEERRQRAAFIGELMFSTIF